MLAPSVVACQLDWLTVSVSDQACIDAMVEAVSSLASVVASAPLDASDVASTYSDYTWFGERVPVLVNRSGVMLHLSDGVHVQFYSRSRGVSCQVTVFSACLWSRPLPEIITELRRFVLSISGGVVSPLMPVRVDIAADVSGVDLESVSSPEYLDACLVSRCCVQRPVYGSVVVGDTIVTGPVDNVASVRHLRRRRRLESLYIGAPGGAVVWNWYDKWAAVRAQGNADRYMPVWSAAPGFSESAPLTRFEVRVNAAFLRSFRCSAVSGRLEVGNLGVALPFLWSYLTDHTRLIDPSTGSGNRSRASVSSLWSLIQLAVPQSVRVPGWRESPNDLDSDRLESQFAGVVLSLLAVLRSPDVSPDVLGRYLASVVLERASIRGGLRSAVHIRAARKGLSLPAVSAA